MNMANYIQNETMNSNTPQGEIARTKENMKQRHKMKQEQQLIHNLNRLIKSKRKKK